MKKSITIQTAALSPTQIKVARELKGMGVPYAKIFAAGMVWWVGHMAEKDLLGSDIDFSLEELSK